VDLRYIVEDNSAKLLTHEHEMVWILILTYALDGPPSITWAGDFLTKEACEAAGTVWDSLGNAGPVTHIHNCIPAKRGHDK
jgi:hypothetical protein